VRVIPNFVPDNVGDVSTTPHAKLAELPAGEFMLFVGAFGRYKGVDVLADAYARMKALDATVPPLVVIGYQTGEYPVQTTNFPPGMIVLQDWPHAAVMQAWQRCTFGVVPSTWSDPCPTTAMEAMACGKALVASRMGGLTDLVDEGKTGFLVTPDDATVLSEAMLKLWRDPCLRATMGEAGSRKVNAFKATAVVDKIESLYGELLNARH
jgi:glycosyltransferase involved in cell wall biosynthesis